MNKKPFLFAVLFLVVLSCFWINKGTEENEKLVNVYGWYGVIPRDVLKDFEKETGIKVVYDVYDNNDVLEAKLLATSSGYDLVFPSFIPYAARQVKMGTYQKLDFKLLTNIKNIEGRITDKFEEAGGELDYLIPIFWETVGIAFERNVVRKIFPNEKIDSYSILLDPEKLKKLHKHGVSFPEEYIDIFPQTKHYLKIADKADKMDSIKKIVEYFKNIRQYITKFSSSTMINDLLSGDVCIAIGPSDNVWRAIQSAPNVGKSIKYILPKGSGILCIDCGGIPKGAPHAVNAHKFLNYLMKPDVAAKIINYSGILVNVKKAENFVDKEIIANKLIYPTEPDILDNLIIGGPNKDDYDVKCDKAATRAWSQIRMNMFDNKGGVSDK